MLTTSPHPLLRLAFRPFFLLAAVYAAVSIGLWALVLRGMVSFQPYGNSVFWHGHELLFGFATAILTGFLLTAVQTWTSQPGLQGKPLLALVLLWLLARFLMAFPIIPFPLIGAIDCAFLLSVTWAFAVPVFKSGNKRNFKFVIVLLVMATANALSHYGQWAGDNSISWRGLYLFIWLLILVISIITGRIMPMFTANGAGVERVNNSPWLETTTIGLTLILVLNEGLGLKVYSGPTFSALLLIAGACFHLLRFLRWRFWLTFSIPLLWSLHASYVFIPLGFSALALSHVTEAISASTATHWLTAGAMANMMLAMISRVALGHTGRPLSPHKLMSVSFILLLLSAVIRGFGAEVFGQYYFNWLSASAVAWVIAFLLYALLYWRILVSPRVDGKAG